MSYRELDVDPVFWRERYTNIVSCLGIDPREDSEATKKAHDIYKPRVDEVTELMKSARRKIDGRPLVIFGCGPSLDRQILEIKSALKKTGATFVAADGATSALRDSGIDPHIVVTDLDGYPPDIVAASKSGSIIFLHFHGDNQDTVAEYLPLLRNVVPITQTKPTTVVRNFGGFTDGDKCLFLSAAFGASLSLLIGMDFGDIIGPRSNPGSKVGLLKKRKLAIGRSLCEDLVSKKGLKVFSLPPRPFSGIREISLGGVENLLGGAPYARP